MKRKMETEQARVRQRMSRIKHKILILSGKGGVGKSTVAVNLAVSLALAGNKVGLLDIDIHGPSIPKILKLEGKTVQAMGNTILPVGMTENLKVVSIGFLLRGSNDAVIWRGPMKYQVIKQFLKDVQWGDLDYLV
ncbi:MAG TPA: P-loop NTPase, partial [Planctomycetes bacterium]|nr:P-loop NTPase [Planctomycetota bacterium]